jgi:hypothetical protein
MKKVSWGWNYGDIIIIRSSFNESLNTIDMNNSCTELVFSDCDTYTECVLYNNLTGNSYRPMSKFVQPIDWLPSNITKLTLSANYDCRLIDSKLCLTHLILGYCFNYTVDNLPYGILNLTFGYKFNCTIDNLPCSLITLNFIDIYDGDEDSCEFNKQLNCLPNSICEIRLPIDYDQEIKNIPSNLKKIICSSSYQFTDKFDNIDVEFIEKIEKNILSTYFV